MSARLVAKNVQHCVNVDYRDQLQTSSRIHYMTRRTVLLVLLALVIPTAVTNAAVFVPSGLSPGDKYQLAFVTNGRRDALSLDIADYNDFVRREAELDGAFTRGFGIEWFAIGSTPTVDARDNAPVSAPVYLLDSTLISTAGPTIYDGFLSSAFDTDQFLSFPGLSLTWTGSSSDGTASPDHALGQAAPVIGTFVAPDANWLDSGVGPANERLRLYAISEELTVPTQSAVPEPATLLSWLLMGGGGLSLFYCCRWRTRAKACE